MRETTGTFVNPLARGCLVAGPLLFAASTFFWHDGRYGATGGALVALAVPIWAYGIIALLDRMRAVPAAVCRGGDVAGPARRGRRRGLRPFRGGVRGGRGDLARRARPVPGDGRTRTVVDRAAVPVDPFALGAGLLRSRQRPGWMAVLLCAGAVLFPISRIPRVEWIAHLVDVILLVPFLVAAVTPGRIGRNTL